MSARPWTPLLEAICTSAKLASLPDDTCRLFYTHLLTQVDSFGRIGLAEHVIHAKVWPLHGKPVSETSRSILECVRARLISAHEVEGRRWLCVPDWEEKAGRHLRRRGAPEFGPPDSELLDYSGSVPDQSGRVPQIERKKERLEKEKRAPAARTPFEDLVRGTSCDTPAFHVAWQEWLNVHGPYKTDGQLKRMIAWGEKRAIAALRYSIDQESQGVYEEKSRANGNGRPEPAPPPWLDDPKTRPEWAVTRDRIAAEERAKFEKEKDIA